MSHTNQTPNYHLPQFIGTDKPAWLVDFNQSMSDIDTQMKANETASATAEANAQSALSGVTALNSQVGGLQTDVTAIQTQMPLDEAQIATNAQNISTQASAIVNANNRIDTANTNITALNTKVGDLADLDTTDKTSVVNAVNELNADIPRYTVIKSSAGNKTYAEQITELKPYFDALGSSVKLRAGLIRGNTIYYVINPAGRFYNVDMDGSGEFSMALHFDNQTAYSKALTTASTTITNISANVDQNDLVLILFA